MRRAMAQQQQQQGRDGPGSKECRGAIRATCGVGWLALFSFCVFGAGEGNWVVILYFPSHCRGLLFLLLFFLCFSLRWGLRLSSPFTLLHAATREWLYFAHTVSFSHASISHAISFSLLGFPVSQWIQLIIAAKLGGLGVAPGVSGCRSPCCNGHSSPFLTGSISQTSFWGAAKHKITGYSSPSFLSHDETGYGNDVSGIIHPAYSRPS